MGEMQKLLALANLLFGIGISVLMFARMHSLPQDLPFRRIAPYAVVLTSGLVSALQPLMGYWPTPTQVFCSGAFFLYIASARTAHR